MLSRLGAFGSSLGAANAVWKLKVQGAFLLPSPWAPDDCASVPAESHCLI